MQPIEMISQNGNLYRISLTIDQQTYFTLHCFAKNNDWCYRRYVWDYQIPSLQWEREDAYSTGYQTPPDVQQVMERIVRQLAFA